MPKNYIVPARQKKVQTDIKVRVADNRALRTEHKLDISAEFDKADNTLAKAVLSAYMANQLAYAEACRDLGLKMTDREEVIL